MRSWGEAHHGKKRMKNDNYSKLGNYWVTLGNYPVLQMKALITKGFVLKNDRVMRSWGEAHHGKKKGKNE